MTEKHIQWLTYHINVEYMFHIALEQLHHIDNTDEDYLDDSILTDCSVYSDKIEEKSNNENKFKYVFNLTIYLWTLLILWIIFHMWTSSFDFQ